MKRDDPVGGPSEPSETRSDLPGWARRLSELYVSGATSMFVLHGNTNDVVRIGSGESGRHVGLAEFLAEQIFGRWDLVLHYDLARGLRAFAGADGERLRKMVALLQRKLGEGELRKELDAVLPRLDRLISHNIMAAEEDRLSLAVLFDHASYFAPRAEPGRLSPSASTHLVTLLNWASSPHVKRLNTSFVLIDEQLSAMSERLVGSPHVAAIEVSLPDEGDRAAFIRSSFGAREVSEISDFGPDQLARLTAGMALTDVDVLIRAAAKGTRRLDARVLAELKKQLIERQCQGLLEYIEPRWSLDVVVGHAEAKSRLREDAALLARGALDSLPMGYLLCGAVGTGKTFLAQCASGQIGVPCVMLKNFRSKYVGETEGNLERVLAVLRAMGPVVVIVDEADAALGDRDQEGDSGTSNRVFGMVASQMGDTRYRGRILWMLLTCRPDLLPIDIKRQGRAEVHIPLFYPTSGEEIRDMFLTMARKLGTKLEAGDLPALPEPGDLSGADIEGIVGRALRLALLAGRDRLSRDDVAAALADFLPSTAGLERELQETAAIIECTDRRFLPPKVQAFVDEQGGRGELQKRLTTLKRLVEAL